MSYKSERINLVIKTNPIPKKAKLAIDSFEDYWLRKHDCDKVLYHYTSAQVIKSILENRSFWCTDVNFMNDTLEIKYGKKIIKERLNSYLKNENDFNVQLVLKSLVQFVDNNVYDTYIACFSEEDDILSQWNNYADSGKGYNIGIQFNNNQNLITKVSHYLNRLDDDSITSTTSTVVLRKVFYEIDEQLHIVNKFISDIVEGTKNTIMSGSNFPTTWGADVAANAFNLLLEIIFSLKSPSFQEEKEWRLVYMIQKKFKEEIRKFKVKDGIISPYLETYIFEDVNGVLEFPLQSINPGPMLPKDIVNKSIEIFLKNNSIYSNHPINVKSKV
ncbi:MAG: DUF2971 domain-containing protein [Ignavibacteriaceae bacterium]